MQVSSYAAAEPTGPELP